MSAGGSTAAFSNPGTQETACFHKGERCGTIRGKRRHSPTTDSARRNQSPTRVAEDWAVDAESGGSAHSRRARDRSQAVSGVAGRQFSIGVGSLVHRRECTASPAERDPGDRAGGAGGSQRTLGGLVRPLSLESVARKCQSSRFWTLI
jgi:hypothetical protein